MVERRFCVPYFDLVEGEEYPFAIERIAAGHNKDTGADGWQTLGLQCIALSGPANVFLTVRIELHDLELTNVVPVAQRRES